MSTATQRTAPAVPSLAPPVVVPPKAREEQVCEWCKEAIAKDASACPHCGIFRGVILQKIALGIGAILVAVLMIFIANSNIKGDKTNGPKEGKTDALMDQSYVSFSEIGAPSGAPLEIYGE